jgi:hypothetical protein
MCKREWNAGGQKHELRRDDVDVIVVCSTTATAAAAMASERPTGHTARKPATRKGREKKSRDRDTRV